MRELIGCRGGNQDHGKHQNGTDGFQGYNYCEGDEGQQEKVDAAGRNTPKRGVIADRAGRRLAVDVEVDSVYGVPSQIADKAAVARELAAATGRDAARYARELAKKRPSVWLERRVSPAVSERIAARRWQGVGFLKENRRFYPQREFGAHVLGLAGLDNQGLAGVELGYDRDLWREAVVVMAERDAHGNDLLVSGPPLEALREGDELRLTLDAVIQFIAQEELGRGVEAANSVRAGPKARNGFVTPARRPPARGPPSSSGAKSSPCRGRKAMTAT